MHRVRVAFALGLLVASSFAACFVQSIGPEGKPCPCPEGWECELQVCRRAPECGGAVRVTGLKWTWRTTRSIRWEWSRSGDDTKFGGYELVLTSERPGAAGVKTWTSDDNPELRLAKLPTHPNSAPDGVLSTITHELTPDTLYHARLIAKDNTGATCSTRVVDAQTQSASGLYSIRIFDNGFPVAATPDPPSLAEVTGGGGYGDSTSHLEVHWKPGAAGWPGYSDGDCTPTECYENIKEIIDIPTSQIRKANFDDAFFEIAFSYFGEPGIRADPAWWSSLFLNVTYDGGRTQFFGMEPLTLRAEIPGAYRVLQFPLHAWINEDVDAHLSSEDIAIGLNQFFVGGRWTTGSVIRLDKIYIRY